MSAATIATTLDGAASVVLQVAAFKDSTKHGSFTALSSSLGQILMQLHTGFGKTFVIFWHHPCYHFLFENDLAPQSPLKCLFLYLFYFFHVQ